MKYLFFLSILIILVSCKKEEVELEIPYSRVTLFNESFNNPDTWISLPENANYTPGAECVRIENNILKLTFDQPIQNCGCAWVGAKKEVLEISDIPSDKLGVRIKLNRGFFQHISRYHDTINPYGGVYQTGTVISNSYFRFSTPGVQMQIASSFNGSIHRDSIVDENHNKLEGVEFELILTEGGKLLFIDGVKVDHHLVNISRVNTGKEGLNFQFTLGHQPEFSPRLDELFIEELEVFTWRGKYPE